MNTTITVADIIEQLRALENSNTKRLLTKHGAREPFYGVKIEDLKKIHKKYKITHELALELYDTGISDAMYLAGLVVDAKKMTKAQIQSWAEKAYWYMLSEYTVAWVAADSNFGLELALEWIDSSEENIAASGWSTLSSLVAIKNDADLNLQIIEKQLNRVASEIKLERNRVRHTMNGFVIAVGGYCAPLVDKALQVAHQIGKVEVDMGGTACKEPIATDYIAKIKQRGDIKKRKTARC